MRKVKVYNPPAVAEKSVYALENNWFGATIYVVGPGPSLAEFPLKVLDRHPTIGVNAALECFSPTYWLFGEGYFLKKYHGLYTSESTHRIVTPMHRAVHIRPLLPNGKELYSYATKPSGVLSTRRRETGKSPWWRDEQRRFLPGLCTVAANAISLAQLLGAARIVLVGIDFSIPGGRYYDERVVRNPGPKLKQRALSAGRVWVHKALRAGVWRGPEILTTSPYLRLPVRHITVEEAISLGQ